MTHKERMLAAIRGEPTDRIPYAPRLDLWYWANKQAGTLPAGFEDATLKQIVDDNGMSFHAVAPEFRDLRGPEDDADRALGIYNLAVMPCQTVFDNIERVIETEGDRTRVTYHTPKGSLRTVTVYDKAMREAGISITHVEEYAFKSPEDYEPLRELFRHARAVPNYEGFEAFAAGVGERGIPVAYVSSAASPMHLLQREIMRFDVFFYEMHDHPDEINELSASIQPYWNQMLDVASRSPAEVLLLGANYDAAVTYPPFFKEYITPTLQSFARTLHAQGKYLLTHTDGENTGLLTHYLDAEIDIADSICPQPMTKLSLKEVRDAFGKRITVMGGIPSVALLKETMDETQFDEFLDGFFEEIGDGSHLILGISDTTPPAAEWSRLLKIRDRVEAFGRVGPSL